MSYQPRQLAQQMNHSFSMLPAPTLPRSKFNWSHKNVTTGNAGVLIPVLSDILLPSDTIQLTPRIFGRLLTQKTPVMDNIHLDWHAFAYPLRLGWINLEKFFGERRNPDSSIDFICPIIRSATVNWEFSPMGLGDYFGYPTGVPMSNAADDPNLPNVWLHRAYHDIWDAFYRDQNLQDSFVQGEPDDPAWYGDGPDDPTPQYDALLPRNMRHTYITSGLPWPQKGDAVLLPLGLTAPVIGNGLALGINNDDAFNSFHLGVSNNTFPGLGMGVPLVPPPDIGDTVSAFAGGTGNQYIGVTSNPARSGLIADLSTATASDINTLREAIAVQHILETDARGGTRYIEMLFRDYGAISPDFRVQRPEFLGGGTSMLQTTAIADTGEDLGELGGVSTVGAKGNITYTATEHCVILVLASFRVDLTFQNRMDRRWTKRTKYDFFRQETAHLGEQPIKNREVWWSGNSLIDDDTWGYIGRWDEHRYRENMVTGLMRSNVGNSLDIWHYSTDYGTLPALNGSFIQDPSDVVIRRTVVDQEGPLFKIQCAFDYYCTSTVPVYGIPGLTRL